MADPTAQVTRIKSMFSDLDGLAERLHAATTVSERSRFETSAGGTSVRRLSVLSEGAKGLELIRSGRESELTDKHRQGLEAIVCLEGRPAIMIVSGDFVDPPPQWKLLADHRAGIRESIKRVGRIEVTGHRLDWVGTGFLVGQDVVMTNRHVAVCFSERDGKRWTFKTDMTSSIDLVREQRSRRSLSFKVTEIIGIHNRHDLALLRVEQADEAKLPEPLAVAAEQPPDVSGSDVYVVGFPAKDERNDPAVMQRIFSDVYDYKRLQPGKALQYFNGEPRMAHDCTTLGGNSGSPLFDLATHRVIGLHFAGRYGERNFAVPLWTLTDDPLVQSAGIRFET